MSKRGGKREGAGRKPKADEYKLIELMDKTMPEEELIEIHAELVRKKDITAVKLWYQYRYGNPRQLVDVTTQGEKVTNTAYFTLPNGERVSI